MINIEEYIRKKRAPNWGSKFLNNLIKRYCKYNLVVFLPNLFLHIDPMN